MDYDSSLPHAPPKHQTLTTSFFSLLLQFIHINPALPDRASLENLGSEEWRELIYLAIQYRLGFQVLERLKADEHRLALAPAECLRLLKEAVRATLMRNMRQEANVRKILNTCQNASIPVILVKGFWLVERAFGDLKAREAGDIDLLFHPVDMARFTDLARDLGFELPEGVTNILDLTPAHNEFALSHPSQDIELDIHWSLTRPDDEEPIDEEKLWQRSESFPLAGTRCQSLSLEDHLLYVCFHAAGHHRFVYVGPRVLLDVAQLINNPPRPIDWPTFVVRAIELGWERETWLMCDLVREHLGVQPPQTVLDALRPSGAGDITIRSAAIEAMFMDQRNARSMAGVISRVLQEATVKDRARLLIARLFPPRAYVASQFQASVRSPGIQWLYVRRFTWLLGEHLPGLARLVTGNRESVAELKRTQTIRRWMEL